MKEARVRMGPNLGDYPDQEGQPEQNNVEECRQERGHKQNVPAVPQIGVTGWGRVHEAHRESVASTRRLAPGIAPARPAERSLANPPEQTLATRHVSAPDSGKVVPSR